jgi:RNA polymerase sigma-70 factor (sigma-E family)
MVRHAAVTLWSRLPGNDPVMGGNPAARDFRQPDHTVRVHAATRREETRAPADAAPGPVSSEAGPDAEQAITAIYGRHYYRLVRLAAALVGDVGTAEEVVQDAFIAMCGAWSRLRDRDKALAYVRQSVLNRSRSVLRHRVVAGRTAPEPAQDMPSAEHGAITQLERSALISAMRALAPRQREALVLRFYLDLSEGQVASAMGISRGTVKCHTARAKAALRSVL